MIVSEARPGPQSVRAQALSVGDAAAPPSSRDQGGQAGNVSVVGALVLTTTSVAPPGKRGEWFWVRQCSVRQHFIAFAAGQRLRSTGGQGWVILAGGVRGACCSMHANGRRTVSKREGPWAQE